MPKLSTVYNPCIIQSQRFLFSLSGQSLSRLSNGQRGGKGRAEWCCKFHACQNSSITSLFLEREMKTTAFLCAERMVIFKQLAHWPPDSRMCFYCLNHTWTPERTSPEMENGKWSLSWRMSLWTGGGPGAEHRAQGVLSNSVAAAHHQPLYSHEDKVLFSNCKYNSSHLLIKWFFSELLGTSYSRKLGEDNLSLMYF